MSCTFKITIFRFSLVVVLKFGQIQYIIKYSKPILLYSTLYFIFFAQLLRASEKNMYSINTEVVLQSF